MRPRPRRAKEIVQRTVKNGLRILTANSTMRASTMLPTTVTKSKVFHESLKQLCKKEEVEKLLHITSSTGLKLLQLLSCHHAKSSTEHRTIRRERASRSYSSQQQLVVRNTLKAAVKICPFMVPKSHIKSWDGGSIFAVTAF